MDGFRIISYATGNTKQISMKSETLLRSVPDAHRTAAAIYPNGYDDSLPEN